MRIKARLLILFLLLFSKNSWAEIYKCPDNFKIGGSTNILVRIPCDPDSDICCNPTWHGEDKAFAGIQCYTNQHKLELTSGDMYCSEERIRRIGNHMWESHRVVTNTANTPDMVQDEFYKGLKKASNPIYLNCGDSICVVQEQKLGGEL